MMIIPAVYKLIIAYSICLFDMWHNRVIINYLIIFKCIKIYIPHKILSLYKIKKKRCFNIYDICFTRTFEKKAYKKSKSLYQILYNITCI